MPIPGRAYNLRFTCHLEPPTVIIGTGSTLTQFIHSPFRFIRSQWSTEYAVGGGGASFCQLHQSLPCCSRYHFRCLTHCSLYRVSYSHPNDWEAIVRLSPHLKFLHLESSVSMTDNSLHSILTDGYFQKLEVRVCAFKILALFLKTCLIT